LIAKTALKNSRKVKRNTKDFTVSVKVSRAARGWDSLNVAAPIHT
jgi:hypothetical protein